MTHPVRLRRLGAVIAAVTLLMGFYVVGEAAARNTLWRVVNGQCLPQWKKNALEAPCAAVNTDPSGQPQSVVLKDIKGRTQFLLVPAQPVTGIESKALLRPDTPHYVAAAWDAKHFVDHAVGHALPRDDIGLAINAMPARSQDQLHIHIDCLHPAVIQALKTHLAVLNDQWERFPVALEGQIYFARKLDEADLASTDPIHLLADLGGSWRHAMGMNTLVMAGITLPDQHPGFVLLARRALAVNDPRAHGEDLLDHACTVAG